MEDKLKPIAKDTQSESVINLSEKMEEIRVVQAEEDIKKIYGEDRIKPLTDDQAVVINSWGYKKRARFAELMDLGKDNLEAYDIIENHGGKLVD